MKTKITFDNHLAQSAIDVVSICHENLKFISLASKII